jgi:hypothetical protein
MLVSTAHSLAPGRAETLPSAQCGGAFRRTMCMRVSRVLSGISNRYLEKEVFRHGRVKPSTTDLTFFIANPAMHAGISGASSSLVLRAMLKSARCAYRLAHVATDGRPGGRSAPCGQRGGTGAAYRDHLGRCNRRPDSNWRLP